MGSGAASDSGAMLTDLGMNIPANGPFVISQVLNKGKKSKSKQGILEIRATFGSACSAGYALAGACCAPRQDPGGVVLSISFPY